ncbi:MAG: rhodanese-like domain-containing protein [Pirellulales bacterium]
MKHNDPMELLPKDISEILADSASDVMLLDCREQEEFAIVRIEGARLLPMGELAARIDELEPWRAKRIIVYCHHGVRSLRVVRWLRDKGFSKASSMKGGIDQWSACVNPSLPRY